MVPFFVHFFNGNGRKIAHYIFVLSDRVRKWDRKYGQYGIRKNTYLSVYERVMVHFWCRFLGIEKAYKVGNQSLIDFRLRSEGDSNPRNAFDVYTLSRRASSTTRAPLRLIAIASVFLSNLLPKMEEITAFSAKAMRS